MKPWERVRAFCHHVGVEFRTAAPTSAQQAPFSIHIGIGWRERVLYICPAHLTDPLTIGRSIHEIGHIVATKEPPANAEELDFTGWEAAAAVVCDVRRQWWALAMSRYGTDEGWEFGEMGTREQRAFIRRMTERGKRIGNVSPSGRPVSLR